ncbi:ABC transporter substrate-binding protein [Falsirhodobacter sp. 20TX0035]|uniref:ABC transporter substrate-binding protein n=1 Tax=Falsirhodobacter sp. 20TX0035 TaxID=3022019 RepID=UPI0023307EC3|nr:ABC transporter substrate-binding protein [Falsirhodobacter sp. 20TX0035]MDB6454189.1 ABC transporter substrate-binding protein [Falsirhodobacter sp. 20TX0035]
MIGFLTTSACAVALLIGTAAFAAPPAGSKLTVATIGEPATLDVQLSPVILVQEITQHIFETLFALDTSGVAKPLLAAAMPEVSADGLTYVIPLRQDVTFHNDAPMTAQDVTASLMRWTKINSKGKAAAAYIDTIEATGDHEVTIRLKERFAPLVAMLSQYSVIMPESTLADPLVEFVGTGPFRLEERRPDQYIDLRAFEGYTPPAGEADGYAGAREAMVEQLVFTPVPDANTRVEGVLAGQYDYADSLPISAFDRLEASDVAEPVVLKDSGWMSLNMNMKEGVLTDVRLRQAVANALNSNDLMAAAFDDPGFFTVNGALFPESSTWYSTAGMDIPAEGDMEHAQELLKEAGYDGTPLRILTTRQYEFNYKMAQVAEVYLEMAGFDVDLQVSDWATLTSRRGDLAAWDIFITNSVFPPDPSMHNTFTASYPGWYETPGKDAALASYLSAVGEDAQKDAADALQTQFFTDMPIFKVGDFNSLSAASKKLQNLEPAVWPFFWNVSVGN